MSAMIDRLTARRDAAVAERQAALDTMEAISEVANNDNTRSDARLTADEETEFAAAEARVAATDPEIVSLDERIAAYTAIEERAAVSARGASARRPIVPGATDVPSIDDTRGFTPQQMNDTICRSLEAHGVEDLTQIRRVLQGTVRARTPEFDRWRHGLHVRSTEAYESAWSKMMSGRQWDLTEQERAAIAVGTNTQGGYLVPTHLDPTIMLTNAGSSNAVRGLARVVNLVHENTWHGVSSAGVTASWDGEIVEVSDDTPSFAGPSIPTYIAQAFAQAHFAATEDIAGLQAEMLILFADAKDRLEGTMHCTGSGIGQGTGIFTHAAAVTNSRVVTTTAATIGLVDLQAMRRKLGVRFRKGAQWLYAPVYGDAIKALGTALSASYSTNITEENTEKLLGYKANESDDAPTTQTTTALDPLMVFANFRDYVIVDKPGSLSTQYIPALFNTANNLPDGRSGWFMHWRTGADLVVDAAAAILQDKTSA